MAVYDQVMGRYKSVPFVPDIKDELTAAVFGYLAKEEAAIRYKSSQTHHLYSTQGIQR